MVHSIVFGCVYLVIDAAALGPAAVVSAVFAALSGFNLYLSGSGRLYLALVLNLVEATALLVVLIVGFLGSEPGVQLYFLFYAIVPTLVFPRSQRVLKSLLFVVYVGIYLFFHHISPVPGRVPIPSNWVLLAQALSTVGSFTSIFLLFILTQREAARHEEQLRQLNSTKDRFFHLIAHDLKNPLGSMMNLLQLAVDKENPPSDSELAEYLESLNSLSGNLFELLNNLLIWASDQEGDFPFEPRELGLRSVIDQVLPTTKLGADTKEISIECRVPASIKVFADDQMIQSVLRNLVGNSIKFSLQKQRVIIDAAASSEGVEILVRDEGVGMPPEISDQLFRPGTKIRREGTQGESGTGLGLLLCKAFMDHHGGWIRAESEPGRGTDMTVFFPSRSAQKPAG